MPGNTADDQTRVVLQARAWTLRQHGWSQARIAADLGVDQSTVSRWLDRIERRELARLSKRVESAKVRQTHLLDHVIDEAFQAWERSKKPKSKVSKKTTPPRFNLVDKDGKLGPGDVTQLEEAHARDGEPFHLTIVLNALRDQRRIWGLDAPERSTRETHPGQTRTFSAAVADMKASAAAHEAEIAALETAVMHEPEPDNQEPDG